MEGAGVRVCGPRAPRPLPRKYKLLGRFLFTEPGRWPGARDDPYAALAGDDVVLRQWRCGISSASVWDFFGGSVVLLRWQCGTSSVAMWRHSRCVDNGVDCLRSEWPFAGRKLVSSLRTASQCQPWEGTHPWFLRAASRCTSRSWRPSSWRLQHGGRSRSRRFSLGLVGGQGAGRTAHTARGAWARAAHWVWKWWS